MEDIFGKKDAIKSSVDVNSVHKIIEESERILKDDDKSPQEKASWLGSKIAYLFHLGKNIKDKELYDTIIASINLMQEELDLLAEKNSNVVDLNKAPYTTD